MIAVFVVIGLTVLLRQRGRQRPVLMLLVGAFGYVVTLIDVVSYRINEAILDVTKTFSGSLANADYTENTSSFRIMHFMERFTYIMKLPHGWLIGLGLLHEDTPQAANLSFEVGNFSKHVGRISQTETSDLLYSLLLTQLGIVGMILYLVVLFQFARFLYQRMRTTPYCLVGFLWLVQALLTSISGVESALIPFRTLIMLFLVVVLKSSIRPLVRPTEASPAKLVAVY
jgi:hypothetical protein